MPHTTSFALGQESVKPHVLLLLTSEHSSRVEELLLQETRHVQQQAAPSSFSGGAVHQQHGSGFAERSGHGEPSHHQHYPSSSYGPGAGPRGGDASSSAGSVDMTEVILSACVSCPSLTSIRVEKASLNETEAAALAKMSSLKSLTLATNTSSQPLRRPLVQLMLSSLVNLTHIRLSYVRDTTADIVHVLPRLAALESLAFHYAYWGESGAGERIMAALSKHQLQLKELRLYECCVNDDMLANIMGISSLRKLLIQDEDAHEDSCPTNRGLAGITRLKSLEHLELFGEELCLDAELLELLSRVPSLRVLAIAGLDALRPDDGAGANQEDMMDMDLDMDLSSTVDEDDSDSDSEDSGGMDEAISRPRCAHEEFSSAGPRRQGDEPPALPATSAGHRDQQPAVSHQQVVAVQGPLQQLQNLTHLRLYGPMSLDVFPPPLALLLPQPRLQQLKLSACASHLNVRALAQQSNLTKLTLSHSNVVDLYPKAVEQVLRTAAPSASAPGGIKLCASILGYHSEVLTGLRQLRILRIKDLPGFLDSHLQDLCSVLCHLPCMVELKLRCLNMVSDVGIVKIAAVKQLQRVKLYQLGDGVTEVGIAHAVASLPALQELKVKECWRVGPTLKDTVAAYRAAAQGPECCSSIVRCGSSECSGRNTLTINM